MTSSGRLSFVYPCHLHPRSRSRQPNRLGVGNKVDRAVLLHEFGDVTGVMAVQAKLCERSEQACSAAFGLQLAILVRLTVLIGSPTSNALHASIDLMCSGVSLILSAAMFWSRYSTRRPPRIG